MHASAQRFIENWDGFDMVDGLHDGASPLGKGRNERPSFDLTQTPPQI
jgi:hypothetical protein